MNRNNWIFFTMSQYSFLCFCLYARLHPSSPKKPATLSTHLSDAGIAASVLGVHRETLIRWARAGVIRGLRPNPNGKWLFDITSVGVAPSPVDNGGSSSPTNSIQAIYA
jgi:hypothetical protein